MASATATKVGHGLARLLGIRLPHRDPATAAAAEELSRGESAYSVSSAGTYVEKEPTVVEWFQDIRPTGTGILAWARSLFPFTRWITRYNTQWLYGDLVAGITVGCVVVPQSMAYALLAELEPQFGLYSSFMGVVVYWFFATSKDITIGPVAVMSLVVGDIVLKVRETNPEIPGHEVAAALAVICGAIICALGLLRLGWIVEFIPLSAISAFMTGSAINIATGQVPALMGITGFDTRASAYKVIINTLKYLGRTKIDAVVGLSALCMLYLIRYACVYGAKRMPLHRKGFFFLSTLRTAFVIMLYTLISYLANRNHRAKEDNRFRILGTVPRGFKHAAIPTINKTIISAFANELPASVIVLLIEHIAISKSFGRINNYTIDPSQEMVAIGVTNLLGPFLGAYPATGSFSRTAIKSKAGVRTPFAGVITGIVVLLAIYALPAAFYYIPSPALSAVIIHAVGDLITPPSTVFQFWRVAPLEVVVFFAGVFVTVFTNIENGIYTTIAISVAILLFRTVKARGRFLGKITVHSVIGDHLTGDDGGRPPALRTVVSVAREPGGEADPDHGARNIFLPLSHHDGSNPAVEVRSPSPGIFIYRFSEGFNYPNANHYLDHAVAVIFQETRRTDPHSYGRLGDRPWNDPGPRRGQLADDHSDRPTLKAIILDFSSVNNVDITSVQHLIDVRNQLDQYTAPEKVDWHLACITNRWTKRALAAAGFGYPTTPGDGTPRRWKPIFSVAEIGDSGSAAATADRRANERLHRASEPQADIEYEAAHSSGSDLGKELEASRVYEQARPVAVVQGLNLPLFHIDLTNALQSAIANVEAREPPGEKVSKLI